MGAQKGFPTNLSEYPLRKIKYSLFSVPICVFYALLIALLFIPYFT